MAFDINQLDLFGRQQDRVIGKNGMPLPDNPIEQYRYLDGRRRVISGSTRQRPLLRLWDKNMRFIGQIAQERSVRIEELMADSGGGSCVIRRDNWLSNFILYDRRVEEDLHFTLDSVPTQRTWRTRWGGKVIGVNAKRDSGGLHTVELELVSNREHAKHILVGANPIFPP